MCHFSAPSAPVAAPARVAPPSQTAAPAQPGDLPQAGQRAREGARTRAAHREGRPNERWRQHRSRWNHGRAALALKTQAESSRLGEELQPDADGSASLRAVRTRRPVPLSRKPRDTPLQCRRETSLRSVYLVEVLRRWLEIARGYRAFESSEGWRSVINGGSQNGVSNSSGPQMPKKMDSTRGCFG